MSQWQNMEEARTQVPCLLTQHLDQSRCHSLGPSLCDLLSWMNYKGMPTCFLFPIFFSQLHFYFTLIFSWSKGSKIELSMKIVALGLYCQCYSDGLLGVHTPILLTWKYIKLNITGRGVWHSGIWKALWKISHFPSFLHPFSAGSEIKLGLRGNIPNFGAIGCM